MEKTWDKILSKDYLSSKWKELERTEQKNQIIIRICHKGALLSIDPKVFQSKTIHKNKLESVVIKGVRVPNGMGIIGDVLTGIVKSVESGLVKGVTIKEAKKTREKVLALHPEDSDYDANILIMRLADEKIAQQTLDNYMLTTQGFDIPIPGMPVNSSFSNLIENDILKSFIPKEQLKEMKIAIKKTQAEIKNVKKDYSKSGLKYKKKKYLGCQAVFLLEKKGEYCIAIKVNNFIITGSLLSAVGLLPLGSTFCDSLTKINKEPEIYTEQTDDGLIVRKTFSPEKSNYATESYLHKEEVEKIFELIIPALKK